MNAKITVQKWTVRGQVKWAVHRMDSGKRKRTFFASKKAAEAEAILLRAQRATAGDVWLALPAPERQRLSQVYNEARELGAELSRTGKLEAALKAAEERTAADMDDLRRHFLAQGMTEEQAEPTAWKIFRFLQK